MFGKGKGNIGENTIEFSGIKFTVKRKNVKYFRVSFSPEGAVITTPYFGDVQQFLEHNRDRILKKSVQLSQRIEKSLQVTLSSRTMEEFKSLIWLKVNKYSLDLGVKVNEIKFRKMKRTMGNCRKDGTVTFNSMLKFMPDRILDYIVFHELLHLKITDGHSNLFRKNIKSRFPDYRILDETIRHFILRITGDFR